MLEVFKYGKKVDIPCFICDAPANFDIHITSHNGAFTNINICGECLKKLKQEFENFEIPAKIKL